MPKQRYKEDLYRELRDKPNPKVIHAMVHRLRRNIERGCADGATVGQYVDQLPDMFWANIELFVASVVYAVTEKKPRGALRKSGDETT